MLPFKYSSVIKPSSTSTLSSCRNNIYNKENSSQQQQQQHKQNNIKRLLNIGSKTDKPRLDSDIYDFNGQDDFDEDFFTSRHDLDQIEEVERESRFIKYKSLGSINKNTNKSNKEHKKVAELAKKSLPSDQTLSLSQKQPLGKDGKILDIKSFFSKKKTIYDSSSESENDDCVVVIDNVTKEDTNKVFRYSNFLKNSKKTNTSTTTYVKTDRTTSFGRENSVNTQQNDEQNDKTFNSSPIITKPSQKSNLKAGTIDSYFKVWGQKNELFNSMCVVDEEEKNSSVEKVSKEDVEKVLKYSHFLKCNKNVSSNYSHNEDSSNEIKQDDIDKVFRYAHFLRNNSKISPKTSHQKSDDSIIEKQDNLKHSLSKSLLNATCILDETAIDQEEHDENERKRKISSTFSSSCSKLNENENYFNNSKNEIEIEEEDNSEDDIIEIETIKSKNNKKHNSSIELESDEAESSKAKTRKRQFTYDAIDEDPKMDKEINKAR
jgi:hypothetical protein